MIHLQNYKAARGGYTSTVIKVTKDNVVEVWAHNEATNGRTYFLLEASALESTIEDLIEAMELIEVRRKERNGQS